MWKRTTAPLVAVKVPLSDAAEHHLITLPGQQPFTLTLADMEELLDLAVTGVPGEAEDGYAVSLL